MGSKIESHCYVFFERHKDILNRFSPTGAAAVCIHVQSNKHGKKATKKELETVLGITPTSLQGIKRILKSEGRLPIPKPIKKKVVKADDVKVDDTELIFEDFFSSLDTAIPENRDSVIKTMLEGLEREIVS